MLYKVVFYLHFQLFFRRYHFDGVDGRVYVTEQHHGGHERRERRQQGVFDVLRVREPLQLDFRHLRVRGPVVDQRLGDLVLQEQKRFRQVTWNAQDTEIKYKHALEHAG